VLKDHQVIYEKYLHGASVDDRFLSMSVGKSRARFVSAIQ
jgi:hypothetical protein